MNKCLRSIIAILLLPFFVVAQPDKKNPPQILFLGNSITYAGNYITDFETWYILQHPDTMYEFVNLGLPSETVSGLSETGHAGGRFPRPDLHERLGRILKEIKPQIVFACYGMNDGIYLPFSEERFQKYKEGIIWLHDTLKQTGARVIMMTPPVYDELRGAATGYAQVLDKYADWLLSQRKNANWDVADVHYPMKKYLEAHRKLDATFGVDGFALAADGVHPGETGHWLMAKQLLLYSGEKKVSAYSGIKAVLSNYKNGEAIYKLVTQRQNIMKDAWLTATGHTRPEMSKGLPLEEAKLKAAEIALQIDALKK